MPLTSTYQAAPLAAPLTLPSDQVDLEALDNALVVQGAFGTSGVYPLDQAARTEDGRTLIHCSLYFIRLAPGEVARANNPVVIEKTTYALRHRGDTLRDEAICTRCENRQCPANQHPEAASEGLLPGKLVLSLA